MDEPYLIAKAIVNLIKKEYQIKRKEKNNMKRYIIFLMALIVLCALPVLASTPEQDMVLIVDEGDGDFSGLQQVSDEEMACVEGNADCAGAAIEPLNSTQAQMSLSIAAAQRAYQEYKENGGKWSWKQFIAAIVVNAATGGIAGAITGATGGTMILPGIGTISGAAALGLVGAVVGAACGGVGYTIGYLIVK